MYVCAYLVKYRTVLSSPQAAVVSRGISQRCLPRKLRPRHSLINKLQAPPLPPLRLPPLLSLFINPVFSVCVTTSLSSFQSSRIHLSFSIEPNRFNTCAVWSLLCRESQSPKRARRARQSVQTRRGLPVSSLSLTGPFPPPLRVQAQARTHTYPRTQTAPQPQQGARRTGPCFLHLTHIVFSPATAIGPARRVTRAFPQSAEVH
jgi:hypothetical protein